MILSDSNLPVLKETLYKRTSPNYEKAYKSWWTCDDDVHEHMVRLVRSIQENQNSRRADDLRHAFLYQNRQTNDVMLGTKNLLPDRYNVTYNVVKSCVDTLTSKITQNRPRPRILTEKGNYEKQDRAKKLTQYLDGILDSAGTYRQGTDCFRDSGVFGDGVIKVIMDSEKGRVRTERVLITEIIVDDLEAAYGDPRCMYQVRKVARDALMAMFPEKAREIASAHPVASKGKKQPTEMIEVIEGWHVGQEGRHVIAIAEACLLSEPWEFDCFPFAFFKYMTNLTSFYGQGIAEELMGTQIEINKILRDIQRAQHLIAVPRVLMEQNSKVNGAHLTNDIGSAIKYQGVKPDFMTPTAMNNEIYNHVKWLIQSAFEKVGVSQLSASSKKPAGLDSGRAIREYKDAETERFSATETRYREFYNDIVKLVIKFSRAMYEKDVDLKITVESRKFIQTIKWSEVDMEDDCFTSRVYSSSLFPNSPAAKLQKIEEMVRAGWMDKETAIRLMDFPDVEAWETLETADRDFMDNILNSILGKGVYIAPEPEMMLDKDIEIARKAYLEARNTGASEENLELLLRWIEAAASLLPPLPAPPPMAPGPLAAPMPVPQSGLLPQG